VAGTRTRSGVYGGRTAEERQAERRTRLVDSAREIWIEQGWAAVTMRGVCARAGLTDRYFYENFADVDALLAGVWDEVAEQTLRLVLETFAAHFTEPVLVQLRLGIAAYVRRLVDDPGRAQIFFGDHAGSAVLEQRREQTLQTFTDLLHDLAQPHLRPGADANAFRMTVLMGIGGFQELIRAWQAGIVTAEPEQIIEQSAWVGELLGAQFLPAVRS
jgi:AcrR family transcriptional regulator